MDVIRSEAKNLYAGIEMLQSGAEGGSSAPSA